MDNPKTDTGPGSNAAKDPDDWITGDEPMTGAQASYLKTLCEDVGESFDPDLTKAQASKMIDDLRARDPRLNGEAKADERADKAPRRKKA
jgi:hypothetical protein